MADDEKKQKDKTHIERVKLTDAEAQRLTDLINEKGELDPTCEFCGQREFMTGDFIVHPWTLGITYEGKYAAPISAAIHPLAIVTCDNCGNVKFFNTLVLGFKPDIGEGEDG